jgi:hypothetical protein
MGRASEIELAEWNRIRFAVPLSEEIAAAAVRAGWAPSNLLAEAIADAARLGWTVGEAATKAEKGRIIQTKLDYRPVGQLEKWIASYQVGGRGVAMTSLASAVAREFMTRYGLDNS